MNVAPLDHLQKHAIQMDNALVSQMLLAPNVQNASQTFMDFPTAKV